MPLTVLSVAYPFAPVGLDAVGGSEQILSLLERGLVQRGHRSLVVACEGSTAFGTLFPSVKALSRVDSAAQQAGWAAHRAVIEDVLRRKHVDVVHFHGLDFASYLPDSLPCAAVATLHLPPGWHGTEAFKASARGVELICVSESQRRACPDRARIHAVIPNGISLDELRPVKQRGSWLVMLGRICPEKGFHLALEAAHRANVPLVLAGRVFPYEAHQRYFAEQVAPLLDEKRRFIGAVGRAARTWLLSHARALLVPSLVPETSSLVAMEAMACGTPVIAFRAGALPDLVEHGRTGFVVEDVDGIVHALARLDDLDPTECRRRAEERFSAEAMIDRYLDVYERLVSRHARARTTPAGASRPERIERLDELERLSGEWRALWQTAPGATPFNHPDWLIPWCRHFGRERIESVAIVRGGRLAALAPLEIWNEGSVRVLKLLGSGVSDALDVLVDPEGAQSLVGELQQCFLAIADRWDACELSPLPAASLLLGPGESGRRVTACDVSPELVLERGRAFHEVVPGRFASNLRHARRRFEREMGASLEHAREEDVDEYLDALVRLHAARWSSRGERGVLADPRVVAFHREVAHRFACEGLLRMEGIRVAGELVAVLYGFSAHRRFQLYLSGFDPAFERFSPGSLLIALAVERALADGDEAFDFLRGAELYKYTWGAVDRPLFRVAFDSPRRADPVEGRRA